MQILAAKDAKYGFGRLFDLAWAERTVAKHGRPAAVVLALEEHERLKALERADISLDGHNAEGVIYGLSVPPHGPPPHADPLPAIILSWPLLRLSLRPAGRRALADARSLIALATLSLRRATNHCGGPTWLSIAVFS